MTVFIFLYCSFQIKYSLDGENFQWYRNETHEKHDFENDCKYHLGFGVKDIISSYYIHRIGLSFFLVTELTYRKIIEHQLDYTVVARAVRFFPTVYQFSGCMTVELYGYDYYFCFSYINLRKCIFLIC